MAKSVKWYYNDILIGEGTSAPHYPFTWKNAPIGTHTISGKLFEDGVDTGKTDSKTITVEEVSLNPYPNMENETYDYFTELGIPNDSTLYYAGTEEQITGGAMWQAHDKFVKQGKADGWYAKGKAFYPERGDTMEQQQVNAINPTDSTTKLQYKYKTGISSEALGGWYHNSIGAIADTYRSFIEIPKTYGALGVAVNSISIASTILSNGKGKSPIDTLDNGLHYFGNTDGTDKTVVLTIRRDMVSMGLTGNPQIDIVHNDDNSKGSHVASLTSDGVQRLVKNGVKIGDTPGQIGTSLPTGNILLRTANKLDNQGYSALTGSFYWIGLGLTETEAISLSNALDAYATEINVNNIKVPAPVLYVEELADPSGTFWTTPQKSSDWPEFGISAPYFAFYSTDHDGNGGAIFGGCGWATMDDLDFNNFQHQGWIVTGRQSETPHLLRVPSAESGIPDEIFMYYHVGGQPQQTEVVTTSGGNLPHLCTWTNRGNPLGVYGDENHTGYARVWRRGINDYIATHITHTLPTTKAAWSSATNPLGPFTRIEYVDNNKSTDNMPSGLCYYINQMCCFKRNNKWYAITTIEDISDTTKRRLGVLSLDNDLKATGELVKFISSYLSLRTISIYIENDTAHILIKGGSNNRTNDPTYKTIFDLTELD